jgi:FtsH-binding integral membrane protein
VRSPRTLVGEETVMSENKSRSELQGVYGVLLGGLMASFVASVVLRMLVPPDGSTSAVAPMVTVLVGLTCAIAFMVGGLYATERLPWLGGSLLFASGFTTLWSVAVSFGAEPPWVTSVALGVAVATGITIGWRRFGREAKAAGTSGDEAVWTH